MCEWIGRVADDGNERGPDRAPAVRQTTVWGDSRRTGVPGLSLV